MTIKQQGGIFGRNPTFNDVDVDNSLTVGNDLTVTDDLTIGSNVLYVDAGSGSVGINTDSPNLHGWTKALTVNTTTNTAIELSRNGTKKGAFALQGDDRVQITTFEADPVQLRTNNADRLVVSGTGDVTVSTGNLVIGTSGKGIDFSATSGTGTSELFDDYEEGTFTPAFISSGQSGSWTYTSQVGHYTKVGNRVFGTIQIAWSAKPSVGAQLWIHNLPFSVHADDLTHSGAYITYMTSGSMPNTNFLSVRTDNNHSGNPTGLEFYEAGTDTINVSTGNNVGSSGNISLVFNYRVA